jgi:hypothetical protein
MRSFPASIALCTFAILASCFAAGCAEDISAKQLAQKVGQPADVPFFGDQAMYMGDSDGYRYVHLRDLFDDHNMIGERDYRVPASQWPMKHPMPLTEDASKWQNVTWMNGDGLPGVEQHPFLHITTTYPLGAPQTQPATAPATSTKPPEPRPSLQ